MIKGNRRLIYAGIFFIVLLAATATAVFMLHGKNAAVATVNGIPVIHEEFKLFLDANSSEVFQYFSKKYGAEDSKDFWERSFNGEVPNEIARRLALKACVDIKLQQVLAKDRGIIKDVSYKAFLDELKQENKSRKAKKNAGGIIYGPEQYGEAEYFNYVSTNMITDLKKAMLDKELAVEEREAQEFYEKNKADRYGISDYIRIQRFAIGFLKEDGSLDKSRLGLAEEKMREIQRRLEQGEKLEKMVEDYADYGQWMEQSFMPESRREDLSVHSEILRQASALKVGKTSSIIRTNVDYSIIRCMEKTEMGFEPYESVKSSIKSELLEEKYKELVARLSKEAKVEVNEGVYHKIIVR